MPDTPLQDVGPLQGHSPDQERALGGYAVLLGAFFSLAGAFAAWFARSGRALPDGPAATDLALVAVASHKLSRLIAKDRIASTVRAPFTRFQGDAGPSEVDEAARGRGLRRAIGELLICPYCLGMWVVAAFTAGLLVAPRLTRWVAGVFVALFGSDALQIAWAKAEDQL